MSGTTTTTAEQAIQEQLKRLEWIIPDAQRRLDNAAKEMFRRAEDAVKQCDAMITNQPCSLMWVDFAVKTKPRHPAFFHDGVVFRAGVTYVFFTHRYCHAAHEVS